jgi:hypothetical protein
MDDSIIRQKIETNAYDVSVPYPTRPEKPYLGKDATPAEIRKYADDVERYNVVLNEYNIGKKKYLEEKSKLQGEFIADIAQMIEKSGATHLQAAKAASYAWEQGHSAGYNEVLIYACDLCDIFIA